MVAEKRLLSLATEHNQAIFISGLQLAEQLDSQEDSVSGFLPLHILHER